MMLAPYFSALCFGEPCALISALSRRRDCASTSDLTSFTPLLISLMVAALATSESSLALLAVLDRREARLLCMLSDGAEPRADRGPILLPCRV